MNTMKSLLFLTLTLVCLGALAEKQPIERYQSVIDRQMFGPLPPGFDPTKRPSEVQKSSVTERELTQEQEKLKSSIQFSAIDVRPSGEVAVGFSDNTDPKAPRIYFLKVGESRDGWTVKEADAQSATMTIVKDDVEVSLTLGGDSSKDAGATARAGGAAQTPRAAGGAGAASRGLFAGNSLRARRQQRRKEEAAAQAQAAADAEAKEAERQAQAEQEKQQREAERAEQRQQLLAIQEELKRVRETKAAEAASAEQKEENPDAGDQTR